LTPLRKKWLQPPIAKEGVTIANGFKINKSRINDMMKEIQREFDKHLRLFADPKLAGRGDCAEATRTLFVHA
jgi:hypothetical protein